MAINASAATATPIMAMYDGWSAQSSARLMGVRNMNSKMMNAVEVAAKDMSEVE